MEKDFANFGLAGLQPKPKADQNLWILINEKNENQTNHQQEEELIRE
jgi:hypothetical protein